MNRTGQDEGRLPRTMRAVRLHAPAGPAGLELDEIETPGLAPGETLVQVYGAAITRHELDWPIDRLPAIPSYELSGVVAAVAPDIEALSPGDSVYALTAFDRDGVAADYAAVPAEVLAPKPRTLDHVESAAVPLAALSAWQGLFEHGRLVEGQRVLIHGATGGVGHYATQLARRCGAYVIGTTSSAGLEDALRFGAHEALDDEVTPFEDVEASLVEPVSLATSRLPGFTSRCTTPARCA